MKIATPELPGAKDHIAWLETALLTVLGLLFCLWLRPGDPFLVHARFPWLALLPLLLGLRHGSRCGALSAIALILGMYLGHRLHLPSLEAFPGSLCAGILVLSLLGGEFCDMWIGRLHQITVKGHYQAVRLQQFTRAYHTLTLSHEALERRMVGERQSLRDALQQLHRRMTEADPRGDPGLPGGMEEAVMNIFAGFGWLQVAALYVLDQDGRLLRSPVARLGRPDPMLEADPVVQTMLRTRQLTTVRDEPGAERPAGLLAAIPLQDVFGRLFGLLAVQEMSFAAFTEEHLNLLALLGGSIGDMLAAASGRVEQEFHLRLRRCVEDARRYGVASGVVGLVINRRTAPKDLREVLLRERRGLDQAWLRVDRLGNEVILLLMPLLDEAGLEGFLGRMEAFLQERYGKGQADLGLVVHPKILGPRDTIVGVLRALLSECRIDAQ